MTRRFSRASCAALLLMSPALAHSATINCDVLIRYSAGTTVVETYQKSFAVGFAPQVDFFDDFSTHTRTKEFDANVRRVDGHPVVTIDYFNDVGVFSTIEFSASLNLRGGPEAQTTSGRQAFSDSQLSPQTNTTDYTLTCTRVAGS